MNKKYLLALGSIVATFGVIAGIVVAFGENIDRALTRLFNRYVH